MQEHYKDPDLLLREAAARHPEALALQDKDGSLTWAGFDARVNQAANALITRGIAPNDRVAILARNSIDYAVLIFGILRAGACIVPLSTLASGETLAAMIRDSEAKLLFVSPSYADMVIPHKDMLMESLSGDFLYLGDMESETTFTEIADAASTENPGVELTPDLGFNLIYSSGTTGTPKGIFQKRAFRAREAHDAGNWFSLVEGARTISSTPLYSNTTLFLFLSLMSAGGCAYLMDKFNTTEFLELCESFKPTHQILVPVQYERILKEPDFDKYDLSSFQLKLSTSAPLRPFVKLDILKRWSAGGLVEIYGMTEGGFICVLVAHQYPDKLDTVGQPSADCDLRIIDGDGKVLPPGQTGEIIGRSPKMMDEYWKREQATAEASWYDENGNRFQRSGDLGWLDEDGFLHLLDRKKDMIISGGFNIYAVDLETALLNEPEVSDVAVVGAPSEAWGETPLAFVVPTDPSAFDGEALRARVNAKLGKAQRISEIRTIDVLPRSPIGKILKRELRDSLEKPLVS